MVLAGKDFGGVGETAARPQRGRRELIHWVFPRGHQFDGGKVARCARPSRPESGLAQQVRGRRPAAAANG